MSETKSAESAPAQIIIDAKHLRVVRLGLQALADSQWNTGHEQIEGDIWVALEAAGRALSLCNSTESGCSNESVPRYRVTTYPGLKKEKDYSARFCNDCWDNQLDERIYKTCNACHEAICPTETAVAPDYLMTLPCAGEPIRKAVNLVFHAKCGVLCNVCCTFVVCKDGHAQTTRSVQGIDPDQHVCHDCLNGASDAEFVPNCAELLEPSNINAGSMRIKPGMRAGFSRSRQIAANRPAAAVPMICPPTPKAKTPKRKDDAPANPKKRAAK